MVEDRLDALLPLAALIDERVTQTDAGAQVEQVLGRDPGLRQPPDHQQLAQVPGVGAVGLGALLVAAPRRGLGRFGEMDRGAGGTELLGHEAPAGRRLQRYLQRSASREALDESAHVAAQRG